MTPPWVVIAASVLSALLAAYATHRWAAKRERSTGITTVASKAADEIHESLLNLYRLVNQARISQPDQRAVAEAVASWQVVALRHKSRMPSQMRHLRHSLWDALSTLFGGSGASDLIPEVMDEPVPPFDYKWWEGALCYLEYVMAVVSAWRDDPSSANKIECLRYGDWLRVTGRDSRVA